MILNVFIHGIFPAIFGWKSGQALVQIFITKNFHPISKTFMRGRGIPEKELYKRGCLRGKSINYFEKLFYDPRLTDSQRDLMIQDIFYDITICPFKGQELHNSKDISRGINNYIATKVMKKRSFRKLKPEIIKTIMQELVPYKTDLVFTATVVNEKYIKHSGELKLLKEFFSNKNINKEYFRETFDKLILEIDDILKLSSFNKGIFNDGVSNEGMTKAFSELIQTALNSTKLTKEDILSLCYSNKRCLRDALLLNSRCTKDGKIVITLLNGAVRA